MAIETRASRGSGVNDPTDKSSLSTGSASSSASGLRRSTRETSVKRDTTPSPTFTRKSGRLEKLTPTGTPIKKNTLSPLRRSQRSNKPSSSSSSGSKNSTSNLGLLSGSKRQRKEKSMVQLTLETKEVSNGDMKLSKARQNLNARAYKAMHKRFSKKQREIVVEGDDFSFDIESPQTSKKIAEQLNDVVERVHEHLQAGDNMLTDTKSKIDVGLETVNNSKKRNETASDAANVLGSNKDVGFSPSVIVTRQDQSPENCVLDTYAQGAKLQRVSDEGQQQKNVQSNEEGNTLFKDKERKESSTLVAQGASEPCINNLQDRQTTVESMFNGGQNVCHACKLGGKLLCCDGSGCERSYHLSCLDPPLLNVPLGIWHCSACTRKKLESGVHAISEGVEAIWDSRELVVPDNTGLHTEKQFFVKYKGLAHVHNQWVLETQLLTETPSLAADFNQKNQVNWRSEWVTPQRLLGKRPVVLPKQHLVLQKGDNSHVLNCHYEWLVKWCGLDYEHVSWEFEDASFMQTVEVQSLMRDYEARHEKTKSAHSLSENNKKLATAGGSLPKLSCLPAGLPLGLDFSHLNVVNNLRDCWNKGANAVIVDDQDRIMKVISFISSLTSTVSQPFLIITTSTALDSWDEEFTRFARCMYTVVYKGDKDVRGSIRSLEFGEGGCVMFQLLITSLEAVIEDLNDLRSIKWEAIIVDEFQCSKIHLRSEQIKVLITDMRLLLVNCELKDCMLGVNLLSLLERHNASVISKSLVTNSSPKLETVKEKLSKYIVNSCKSDCKSDNSRFVEYWVPVEISCMQLEQYCATLLSNVLFLCASSKTDNVGALRDVLVSTRKCCDHPNLMEDFPPPQPPINEVLDFGIKASGKLQLLDTMLNEIRNQGLKVLILFQSIGDSAKIRIGDILDDMVRQRFGENSYERVDGNVQSSRKNTALQNFNSEKQRFVFLLETRACVPSIKLTSVDVVIIFGSDWSPMNDIKSLQKITLDSQREQIITFRLYSCFTMEEKILMLARHEKTRDTKLQNINRSTCHMLLKWGAAYMFRKLDEFHSGNDQSITNKSSESSRLKDVESFLAIIEQNGKENYKSNSMFMKVKQSQGNYICCSMMPGEKTLQSVDEQPTDQFWNRLLEGKRPQWKYLSCPSQRSRKRVHYSEGLTKNVEVEKRRKMGSSIVEPNSPHPIILEANISRKKEGSSGALPQPTSNHGSVRACNLSEVQQVNIDKSDECARLNISQNSLHHDLKPKMARLCEVLQLPDDVKGLVESFLEYVMSNHHVSREPDTILQAFQISLCWVAASLLKYKIDHKESLVRAKVLLNFECKKEEADYVYSMLRCLKKVFLYRTESFKGACSGESSQLLSKSVSEDHLHVNSHRSILSDEPQKQDGVQIVAASQEFITSSVLQQPLGLAHQDFYRTMKDINKKCDKHMRKLLEMQGKEKQDFLQKFEDDRKQLEIKQKTEAAVIRCHSHGSMRTEKLKSLDTQYAEKLKTLEQMRVEQLLNLDAMQSAARKKLEERKLKWVEGLESWAKEELIPRVPPKESGQTPGVADQLVKDNFMEIRGEHSDTICREKAEVAVTNLSHGAGPNLQGEPVSTVPERATTSVLVNNAHGEIGNGNVTSPEEGRNSLSKPAEHQNTVITAEVANECSEVAVTNLSNALAEKKTGADEHHLCDMDSSIGTMVAQNEAHARVSDIFATNIANVGDSPRVIDEVSVNILENQNHGSTMRGVETPIPDHRDGPVEDLMTNLPVMQPETASAGHAIRNSSSSRVDHEDPVSPARVSNTGIQVADANVLSGKDAEINTTDCSAHQLMVGLLCVAVGEVGQQDAAVIGVHEAGTTEVAGVGGSLRQNNETSVEVLDNADDGIIVHDVAPTVISQYYVPQEIPASSAAVQDSLIPSVLDTGMTVDVGDICGESNVSSSGVGQESLSSEVTTVGLQDRVVVSPLVPETDSAKRVGMENCCQDYGVATQFDTSEDQNFVENLPLTSNRDNSPEEVSLANLTSMQPEAAASVQASQSCNQPLQNDPSMYPASTRPNLSEPITAPSTSAIGSPFLQAAPPVYQVPLPVGHDPLQNELDRVRLETEQIANLHEKEKLKLRSDCEKEIEQAAARIREKYEARIKEKETEFGLSKLELDERHNKILMNKILAEAFRSKCVDIRACNVPGALKDTAVSLMQQLVSQPTQPYSGHRSSSIADSLPLPSGSAGNWPILASTTTSRAQAVHRPPATLSGSQFRPLNVNTISHATSANLQTSGQIRAPAPHLQGLRPTTSTAVTTASISHGLQNQRVPNLLPSPSTVLPLRSPSLTSLHQSSSVNILNKPEASVTVPPDSDSSSSSAVAGSQMNDQRMNNSIHQEQVHSGSNSEPVIPPGCGQQQPQPQNGTQENSVEQNEVVCLSDDE
ncbi:Helicase protein MOM1 [Linum perenne]